VRIGYFGKILKNQLPEKYHNLKALKKRGCAVNLNYDTASFYYMSLCIVTQ